MKLGVRIVSNVEYDTEVRFILHTILSVRKQMQIASGTFGFSRTHSNLIKPGVLIRVSGLDDDSEVRSTLPTYKRCFGIRSQIAVDSDRFQLSRTPSSSIKLSLLKAFHT